MKKLSLFQFTLSILALFALLTFPIHAASDFIVFDLFDDAPTGQLPDNWKVTAGSDEGIKVVEKPSAIDKSLEIEAIETSVHLRRSFESQIGTFSVELDFMPESIVGHFALPYIQEKDLPPGPTGAVCIITSLKANEINCHNGGWQDFAELKEGTWYHIKIVTSAESQKYDLYLNGEEIVKDGAHRHTYDSLGELLFGGGEGKDPGNKYLINNVMVYQGAERPYDPASVSPSAKLAETWGEIKKP